jgi:soluble lytic murein transglycosylase-like protein
MRLRFSLACFCLAGLPSWCADAGIVRTTVRVDRGSGRLVRTQVMLPREVPPVEVIARETSSGAPVEAKLVSATRHEVDEIVEKSAATHGVDPLLVRSVMQVESNFNPNAVSPKGAMGLMQLMPATARQLGVTNAFDVRQNIEGGVKFLRYLKAKFNDDRLVLAAYNAGEAAVRKHGWIPPYPETIDYVYKVGKRYGESKRQQAPVAAARPAEEVQPKIHQVIDAQGRIHIGMP